jgi:isopentenyl diphosphate isomerase/L-lactate dehydrogenase-like FMN-dependent dehydrogenase
VSWDLIRHVRDHWKKPLLVKGILHPADAQLALRFGLDGVVVSNHGGRQLDGSISPLEALPEIRAAVGDKLKLICDSGFRRGTDIVKALALGADFAMCGRAMLFGAAAGGEDGVAHAIRLLQNEIDKDLALLGVNRISELSPDYLDLRDFGWSPVGSTEAAGQAMRLRA